MPGTEHREPQAESAIRSSGEAEPGWRGGGRQGRAGGGPRTEVEARYGRWGGGGAPAAAGTGIQVPVPAAEELVRRIAQALRGSGEPAARPAPAPSRAQPADHAGPANEEGGGQDRFSLVEAPAVAAPERPAEREPLAARPDDQEGPAYPVEGRAKPAPELAALSFESPVAAREERSAPPTQLLDRVPRAFDAARDEVARLIETIEAERQRTQRDLTSRVEDACELLGREERQRVEQAYLRVDLDIEAECARAEAAVATAGDRALARAVAAAARHEQARAGQCGLLDAAVVAMAGLADPVVASLVDLSGQVEASSQSHRARSAAFRDAAAGEVPRPAAAEGVPDPKSMTPPGRGAALQALNAEVRAAVANRLSGDLDHRIHETLQPFAEAIRAEASGLAWRVIRPAQSALQASNQRLAVSSADSSRRAGRASKDSVRGLRAAALSQIRSATQRQKDRIATQRARALADIDAMRARQATTIRQAGRDGGGKIDAAAERKKRGVALRWQALSERLVAPSGGARGADSSLTAIARTYGDLAGDHRADVEALEAAAAEAVGQVSLRGRRGAEVLAEVAKSQAGRIERERTGAREALARAGADARNGLESVVTSFEEAGQRGLAGLAEAAASRPGEGRDLVHDGERSLRDELDRQHGDLSTELDAAYGVLDGNLARQSQGEVAAKVADLAERTVRVRGATQRYGTDEELIHATFRRLSGPETDYLHADYQARFRSDDCELPSTLVYDLDDDMRGRELAIALAYLGHARVTALQLDLEQAAAEQGGRNLFVDDRTRAILEATTREERALLAHSEEVAQLRESVTISTQRDLFDTLVDARLDDEARVARLAAIDLFIAMDGPGTDEDTLRRVLRSADGEGERRAIHAEFEDYAAHRGWNQTLDEALDDDLSKSELYEMKQLARAERDPNAIAAATMVREAAGLRPATMAERAFGPAAGPTRGRASKRAILDALDDERFAARTRAAESNPNRSALLSALRSERKKALGAALAEATGGRHSDIDSFLDDALGSSELTYQEIAGGVTRDGLTISRAAIAAGKVPGGPPIHLARMVAREKLERGAAPRDLLVKYALDDEASVDTATLEQALSRAGGPLSQAELAELVAAFRRHWGEDLVASDGEAGASELDLLRRIPLAEASRRLDRRRESLLNGGERFIQFFAPGGKVHREVGGRAGQLLRVLLCGLPRSPIERRYVDLLVAKNASSGAMDWLAGPADDQLDREVRKMEQVVGAFQGDEQGRSFGDLSLGPREGDPKTTRDLAGSVERLEQASRRVHTAARLKIESKEAAWDTITLAADIAASLVLALATAGIGLTPAMLTVAGKTALASQLSSAVLATIGRKAVLGDGVSTEEMANEIVARTVELLLARARVGARARSLGDGSRAWGAPAHSGGPASRRQLAKDIARETAKDLLENRAEALPGALRGEEAGAGFWQSAAGVVAGVLVGRRAGTFAGELTEQSIQSIDGGDELDAIQLLQGAAQDGRRVRQPRTPFGPRDETGLGQLGGAHDQRARDEEDAS